MNRSRLDAGARYDGFRFHGGAKANQRHAGGIDCLCGVVWGRIRHILYGVYTCVATAYSTSHSSEESEIVWRDGIDECELTECESSSSPNSLARAFAMART